jgi:SynChlorMet cassette protein ScmD
MLSIEDKPVANPSIVLREEFDDWALLFDADTGKSFGINPMSVFIWHRLDGSKSIGDILSDIKSECQEVPEEVEEHVRDFVNGLVENGLAGREIGNE